jgi:alpha-L-arabinofuranosidase
MNFQFYSRKFLITAVLSITMGVGITNAQSPKALTVDVSKPGAGISPNMWGVFFEDINLGADGGIYAELVKNRSFEFFKPLMGWKVEQPKFREGTVLVLNRKELNTANPRFIRVQAINEAPGSLALVNEGFRGMGVKKGLRYDFSASYRLPEAGIGLTVALIDSTGKNLGQLVLQPKATGAGWQRLAGSLYASETEARAKLRISFTGSGQLDLDMVSLFPEDTWKGRPGGMRADMIQLLADMKPGFIRFPGGCIVEGFDLSNRYQWKKTIGPIEERQLIMNRWNIEFAHRPTPDYYQTFGLGFFEYFQLAEDIGASPLPILNCGMACQFNSAELVPLDQLDPYVQDALDLIEFANGDPSTTWGKKRAEMGHPAPFHLKMLGIGNENWGPQYLERLKVFQKAIKSKYPEISLVTSSGTDPNGDRFDLLNTNLKQMQVEYIDEHYYRRPEWFLGNARRYDQYPRTASKIFAGEYAAQSDKTVSMQNRNNWLSALSEAAFLTGLERNADVVRMASYAPLFAHIDGWQWTPDLIWVNNLKSYGTPDYHVQKLFSTNRGDVILNLNQEGTSLAGEDSLYATAALDTSSHELIIKVVNAGAAQQVRTLNIAGIKKLPITAKALVMGEGQSLDAVNSFKEPFSVAPVEKTLTLKGKQLNLELAGYSFSVIRVPLVTKK